MKKNGHLIRNIIIRLVIALFPFVPVYGQDELESSVQKFVRERMVFDVQGRNMGLIYVPAGMSLEETLFARFHRSGIYLVKQGARMMKVRVSR